MNCLSRQRLKLTFSFVHQELYEIFIDYQYYVERSSFSVKRDLFVVWRSMNSLSVITQIENNAANVFYAKKHVKQVLCAGKRYNCLPIPKSHFERSRIYPRPQTKLQSCDRVRNTVFLLSSSSFKLIYEYILLFYSDICYL